MAKHKIDQTREERIHTEIIVDCYNESERYSGWNCYLKVEARLSAKVRSPLGQSPGARSGRRDSALQRYYVSRSESRAPASAL
jgi:hypothetical protein